MGVGDVCLGDWADGALISSSRSSSSSPVVVVAACSGGFGDGIGGNSPLFSGSRMLGESVLRGICFGVHSGLSFFLSNGGSIIPSLGFGACTGLISILFNGGSAMLLLDCCFRGIISDVLTGDVLMLTMGGRCGSKCCRGRLSCFCLIGVFCSPSWGRVMRPSDG